MHVWVGKSQGKSEFPPVTKPLSSLIKYTFRVSQAWHVHPPACAVHLEHMVGADRQALAAGRTDLDTWSASANSHGIKELPKSPSLFSLDCERALKGD